MVDLITQYGFALIFANVLIQQMGLPIPVVPTLIVAGALAAEGKFSASEIFAVAFAACAISDAIWYAAGRAIRPSRDEAPVPDIAITRLLRPAVRISIPPLGRAQFGTGEIRARPIHDHAVLGGHDPTQLLVVRALGWHGCGDLGRRRDRLGDAVPSRNWSPDRTHARTRRYCRRC